jgi:alternate signal-mediated exported protein
MNKMIKGALVTGVGVALLLGGGGTLAVWNVQQESSAGQIVAGDLNLTAETGIWTLNGKEIDDISTFRAVPGDELTYTQDLTVALKGDRMNANLTVTQPENSSFKAGTVQVSEVKVTDAAGHSVTNPLTPQNLPTDGRVTASTTFTFDVKTSGRDSVSAVYDFSQVSYTLEQNAPTGDAQGV